MRGIALLEKTSELLGRLTAAATVTATVIIVLSLTLQTFFRYVLGAALSWTEELALLMFTWLVLLAGSLGVREGFHVRITVFVDRLPPPAQNVVARVVHMALCLFGLTLLVAGQRLLELTVGQVSPAVRYPLSLLYSAAPVSGALIAVHSLAHLLRGSQVREPKER